MIINREVTDPRTPLQKLRRTTLYRYLKLCGQDVSDSMPVTRLRALVTENNLPIPDEDKVDEKWFSKRREENNFDIYEDMKRPDLIRLAAMRGIERPISLKNDELKEALRGHAS